jgi:hypothetical protein
MRGIVGVAASGYERRNRTAKPTPFVTSYRNNPSLMAKTAMEVLHSAKRQKEESVDSSRESFFFILAQKV